MSSMQMTSPDSEVMIAGKTHSEIESMKKWTRSRWYNAISPNEREEVKRILETIRRAKISKNNAMKRPEIRAKISGENNHNFGKSPSETTRAKQSAAVTGRTLSKEHIAKISGENNHNYGKLFSKETRAKMSASWTPERRAKMSAFMSGGKNPMKQPEVQAKISGENSHAKRPEVRDKISLANSGENNSSFNNWASREPYCHLWGESLRERYRNHYGRVCVLSDTLRSVMGPDSGLDDFEGHEIFNDRRLSVHHIRGNKMAGCDGTELALTPLQGRFNNKKFDGLKLEDHPFYITLFLLKDIERKHRSGH